MRKFVDLGVKPSKGRFDQIIDAAKQLGYSRIGSESKQKTKVLDQVSRIDLHPVNQNDLGKQLRKLRTKTEIITVHCKTKGVSRQVAHDNRVDFVRFPLSRGKRVQYLDHRQAGLMKDTGVGYEVCVGDILVNDRFELLKRIGIIKKSLGLALKKDIPVVASSGATDILELRDPYGLASLVTLLGVDEEDALDMISCTPNRIIDENRAKMSPNFIEPGVWILDE